MKKSFVVAVAIVFLLAIGFFGLRHLTATQAELGAANPGTYVPNEVLVKFKTTASDAAIANSIYAVSGLIKTHTGRIISGAEWVGAKNAENNSFIGDPRVFRIVVPPGLGERNAIAELLADPEVEFAENNAIYTAFTTPNDNWFNNQWGLHNYGQNGGTADADIDAPEAWDIFTGSSDVTIAIIDSGFYLGHQDLQNNIWTNAGEIGDDKETDGVDNDGNGKIDDWRGWDFVNSDNYPMDDWNPYYHGTHVAGIAAADTNNSVGVAGVSWNAKLMVVKALRGLDGTGTAADLTNAIDYAG